MIIAVRSFICGFITKLVFVVVAQFFISHRISKQWQGLERSDLTVYKMPAFHAELPALYPRQLAWRHNGKKEATYICLPYCLDVRVVNEFVWTRVELCRPGFVE
jgi:hypothetical protein